MNNYPKSGQNQSYTAFMSASYLDSSTTDVPYSIYVVNQPPTHVLSVCFDIQSPCKPKVTNTTLAAAILAGIYRDVA